MITGHVNVPITESKIVRFAKSSSSQEESETKVRVEVVSNNSRFRVLLYQDHSLESVGMSQLTLSLQN